MSGASTAGSAFYPEPRSFSQMSNQLNANSECNWRRAGVVNCAAAGVTSLASLTTLLFLYPLPEYELGGQRIIDEESVDLGECISLDFVDVRTLLLGFGALVRSCRDLYV